jgi:hypothetical protein
LKHADYYATLTRVSKKLRNRLRRHPVFQPVFQENRRRFSSDLKRQYNLLFLGANPAIRLSFMLNPSIKGCCFYPATVGYYQFEIIYFSSKFSITGINESVTFTIE